MFLELQALLEGEMSHHDHPLVAIRLLSILFVILTEQISVAQASLLTASMGCPLYGTVHCIRSVFKTVTFQ